MHSDFHYYGTYALARMAGLRRDVCQTIATAAQFVDDNDTTSDIDLLDGGRLYTLATAHPMVNIQNSALFDKDQRRVWLPFHFLPGNEGKTISERLICRKDSAIAQQMVKHCFSMVKKSYGLHLVGISSHVYADTFSHYGFMGVSSRWNKVDSRSIKLLNDTRDKDAEGRFQTKYGETMSGLRNWRQSLWDKVKSDVAESGTGALGHGAVLKYPDFPYLEWEFSYEHPKGSQRFSHRKNAATFLEACEKIYGLFCSLDPKFQNPEIIQNKGFDRIRDRVKEILEFQETNREKRSAKWRSAAEEGILFYNPEEILPYQGEAWKQSLDELSDHAESSEVYKMPAFRFYQAAATYRTYVLRELLPAHGLLVG